MENYLHSVFRLLFEQNPLVAIPREVYKNIRAIRNLRRNMARAKATVVRLEERLQHVEAYVNQPVQPQCKARLDVFR